MLTFDVYNPTDKTVTTSKVEYDLFGNNKFLGRGVLSYEDIPLNGRPQLSPQQTTTLNSSIILESTNSNLNLIQELLKNSTSMVGENITWEVIGKTQIESTFVVIEKDFKSKFSSDLSFEKEFSRNELEISE